MLRHHDSGHQATGGLHRIVLLGCASLMVLTFGGCASMSEGECRSANWMERGLQDGREGYPRHHIQQHREACQKTGVVPQEPLWLAGWSRGVRDYCTLPNAWLHGGKDRTYMGACTGPDEPGFLRVFQAGKDLARTRRELQRNRSEIDKQEADLKKAEKDEDRKRIRDTLRNLDSERARLRRLIDIQEAAAP